LVVQRHFDDTRDVCGEGEDGDVEGSGAQCVEETRGLVLDDLQRQRRHRPVECGQDLGQDVGRDGGDQAHPQRARESVGHSCSRVDEAVGGVEYHLRVGKQARSHRCHEHAAGAPLDELDAEAVLESRQPLGQGGLADLESRCCRAEVAVGGHRDEGTQLREGGLVALIGHAYQCSATYRLYLSQLSDGRASTTRRALAAPTARSYDAEPAALPAARSSSSSTTSISPPNSTPGASGSRSPLQNRPGSYQLLPRCRCRSNPISSSVNPTTSAQYALSSPPDGTAARRRRGSRPANHRPVSFVVDGNGVPSSRAIVRSSWSSWSGVTATEICRSQPRWP